MIARTLVALCLAGTVPAISLGQILGQDEDPATPPVSTTPATVASGTAAVPNLKVWQVPGFDPVRDVPSMDNWMGVVDPEGGGNCYAISVLTMQFFLKCSFTSEPGLPFERWADAGDPSAPLAMDERGLAIVPWFLARSRQDAAAKGKLRIGGFAGLREFTAEGTPTEKRFREWAEAIQFAMQIPGEGARYIGSIVKANLGFVPLLPLGKDDVNKDGFHIVRDRVAQGRPVPISLTPSSPNPAGHVVVVYRVVESDTEVRFTAYDCNRPPRGSEPRPLIVSFAKRDGWKIRCFEEGSEDRSLYGDFGLLTVPDPDTRGQRNRMRRILTDLDEYQERNEHFGDIIGQDRSLLTRVKGAGGFVLEVLNPF